MTNKHDIDEVARNLVRNEVILCVTSLVEDLLALSSTQAIVIDGIEWEAIENLYIETDAEAEDHGYDSLEEMQDAGEDQKEIFEWWAVDGLLFNNLREMGEVVLNSDTFFLWGRGTTGQAIYGDEVIQRIALKLIKIKE